MIGARSRKVPLVEPRSLSVTAPSLTSTSQCVPEMEAWSIWKWHAPLRPMVCTPGRNGISHSLELPGLTSSRGMDL